MIMILSFALHFFMIYLAYRLYYKSAIEDHKLLILLIVTMYGLFLNDIVSYMFVYFSNMQYPQCVVVLTVLNNIIYMIWSLFWAWFLCRVLFIDIIKLRPTILQITLFIAFNAIILYLFISAIPISGIIVWWLMLASLLLDLIILNFTLICLIYVNSLGMITTLLGVVVIILDDFYSFKGASNKGVAGAFNEFCQDNPGLLFRKVFDYGYGGVAYILSEIK